MEEFGDVLETFPEQNGMNSAVPQQPQLDAVSTKNQQLSQLLSSTSIPSSQTNANATLPHGVIGSLGSSLSGLTPSQQLHSGANAAVGRVVSSAASVSHGIHAPNTVYSNVGANNISMAGNMPMAGAMNQQHPVVSQNLMNQQHMPHMNGPQLSSQPRPGNIASGLSSFNTTGQLSGNLANQNLAQVQLQNQQNLVSGLGQLGQQLSRVRPLLYCNN